MVKCAQGDVFKSNAYVIAHGCNTVGGFGSGVAGTIAKLYPHVKAAYLHKHENEGWKLGDVQLCNLYDHRGNPNHNITYWIANCATQQECYPRYKVHADYDAIRACMEKVKEFARPKNRSIAVPKIGCGLAGGDWTIVSKILEEVFHDYDVTVFVL